jgi:protein-disulfide isomerase
MEDKNNFVVNVVVAAIALLAGLGLVFGMGVAIQTAVAPMTGYLQQIVVNQKVLEKKVADVTSSDVTDMKKRITDLESKLNQVGMMMANAQRMAQAGAQQPGPQQPMPQQPQPPQEDMNKVYNLPLEGSYVLGNANAPATITIFNDYQCPYCSRFYPGARDVVKALPTKVKLVIKHFPLGFHPNAKPAAKAALAAGLQGKFYEMSDLIFQNAAALSDDKYNELAKQAGLNVDKFTKDLKDKDADFEKKIQQDMALAQQSAVQGTPTYFLNGKKNNARDLESWKKEIEAVTGGAK